MSQGVKSAKTVRISRRRRVREELQEMILRGFIRPGQKLAQHTLARKFGVSQGVVREALLQLHALGLAEMSGKSGMAVAKLGIATLLDAFAVREAHEGMIVRLCCQRASRMEAQQLAQMAQDIHDLGVAGKRNQMFELDKAFHLRMLDICGNTLLRRLAEQYQVMSTMLRLSRDLATVRDEHLRIARAIEDGRPDDAELAVREHVRQTKAAVEEIWQAGRSVPGALRGIIPAALLEPGPTLSSQ